MPEQPDKQPKGDLPTWLTTSIVAAFAVTTIVHVAIDIAVKSYEGGATSLMFGGIVGAALAGDRLLRRGGDDT